jgi:hypothetical protein
MENDIVTEEVGVAPSFLVGARIRWNFWAGIMSLGLETFFIAPRSLDKDAEN